MAENNELGIQVGVVLDTSDIGKQLGQIKEDDRKIKIIADTNEVKKSIEKLTKDLQDGKNSDSVKLVVDVLQGESSKRIQSFLSDVQKQYEANPVRIALDVDTKATTANINKAVGEMQQQVQKAVDQAVKSAGSVASGSSVSQAGALSSVSLSNVDIQGSTKYLNELTKAWKEFGAKFEDVNAKVSSVRIIDNLNGTQNAIVNFKNALGELTSVQFEGSKGEWTPIGESYRKSFEEAERAAKSFADQMSKFDSEFDKLYSKAFEQKNPLSGERADIALKALQEYQDKYMEITRKGSQMTADQKREVEELGKAAALAIQEQQAAQDRYNKSVEEQKRVISNIQEELNKVGKIENQAFGGTNALTGDFRKKAEEEIEAVKQKFTEIKKAAEESFEGAANVSKEQLKKITADFAAEINALQKRQYPADKIAAVDVDTKKASVINELNEQEEKLKSLGQTSSEFADRLRQLREELSGLGKIDSDIDAWAKWRNEFNLLEQDIKKFESSVQGMGQKLASGLENNQLDRINDVVNKLNSLDEQYSGAGVDRIKSDFQSLSEEYQKIIDQLQSKDLTGSQFKELSKQAEELDQKLKQLTKEAATFGNQDSFGKFTASTNTLKLNLERLEKQYAALIAKNPELAGKVEDLKQKLENLRPGEIPTITKDISNLGKELGNASGQSAGLRGALTDAFGGFGSYLARFTSSYYIITKTIQGIKKMVNAVKEVDTSLVELQKVTNLTGDSLTQFADKAYQMGAQLGRTGKDVIDAATTFSRAGYDLNEATQLAQSALVMTNVGVDIPNMESAASDMISILKAFDIQAEESMDVIDKLYNVANKEPLDFGNITQMLVTAGGTLAQSGSSLEETMGLLTGAFATMRTSSVANG